MLDFILDITDEITKMRILFLWNYSPLCQYLKKRTNTVHNNIHTSIKYYPPSSHKSRKRPPTNYAQLPGDSISCILNHSFATKSYRSNGLDKRSANKIDRYHRSVERSDIRMFPGNAWKIHLAALKPSIRPQYPRAQVRARDGYLDKVTVQGWNGVAEFDGNEFHECVRGFDSTERVLRV